MIRTTRKGKDPAIYVQVEGDLAYVELTQGRVAVIDAADAPEVQKYLWYLNSGYAVTCIGRRPEMRLVGLHRFLLGPDDGMQVDHINHDTLDNRRDNLRLAEQVENSRNRKTVKTWAGRPVSCEFKGVHLDRSSGQYRAVIRSRGRLRHLGRFDDPIKAAQAYDRAARVLHGEFACTNFQEVA